MCFFCIFCIFCISTVGNPFNTVATNIDGVHVHAIHAGGGSYTRDNLYARVIMIYRDRIHSTKIIF